MLPAPTLLTTSSRPRGAGVGKSYLACALGNKAWALADELERAGRTGDEGGRKVGQHLWTDAGTFVALPPPSPEEVEAVLHRTLRQLRPRLAALEGLALDEDEADLPEGSQSMLLKVPRAASRPGARLAVAARFSLHADTAVHANDRAGLERLCRYGARGALALERLQRLDDGRLEYRSKRGGVLVLSAAALLERLLVLVPPRGLHLTGFHGVFAPNARLRPTVALPAPPSPVIEGLHPPLAGGPRKPPRPRLDWAAVQKHTFGNDVFQCHCGGRRRVVAIVTDARTAEEVLLNLGLLRPRTPLPPARAPPQLALDL